jgi:RNA-directed DNA polymerase
LQGIAQKAASHQGSRCRTRYGRLAEDVLTQCGRDIRQDAAAGVEQVSAQAYEQPLAETRHRLVERLQQNRYRAQLVRRHAIPTGEGPPRPLGIPAVDDKLLQLAVARLLEAIDEQDFLRGSDGDRPQVGALAAVDPRTITRPCGRYAWVVAADSKQFCAPIDHDWMVRMLAERLDDGARLRLLRQWLKAGVLDTDGTVLHPVTGTPQGGPGSPILAQVFRHDALDLWFETVVKQPCRGEACLLRDADDFVGAVEDQAAAERVDTVRGQRLETFGLELSGAKTRIIPVRRHRQAGNTSLEFLGFEVRWGKERTGRDHLTRRTARQQLRASLKRVTAWGQANRQRRLPVLFQRLNATLRGDDHDSGVQGNAASLKEFFNTARRLLLTWRNRRRQRHSDPWQGYTAVLERCTVARPRIVGRPKTRQAALETSADLRKRVFLKSPVRENRTPGAVRGRSGHWPSYRDGRMKTVILFGESQRKLLLGSAAAGSFFGAQSAFLQLLINGPQADV